MNIHDQHKIISIKKNTEIKKILATGKRIQTKYGIFFIKQNKTDNKMNFAVLIKKSVGNAVWRNYCKRIVRAYIRNKINLFPQNSKCLFLYTYEDKINYQLLEEELDKKLNTL
jgi:ribonuclease P protein component